MPLNKKLVLVMTMLLICISFSGCAKKQEEVTFNLETMTDTTTEVYSSKNETTTDAANNTLTNEKAKEEYMNYLDDLCKAKTSDFFEEQQMNYSVIAPGEYSISELKAKYENDTNQKTTAYYALVDLTKDGVDELVVHFESVGAAGLNWNGVVTLKDSSLSIIYEYTDGYRTVSKLYDGGYLAIGGSSGAGAHNMNYFKFNEEGLVLELYAINEYYASFATQIWYDLAKENVDEDLLSDEVYH